MAMSLMSMMGKDPKCVHNHYVQPTTKRNTTVCPTNNNGNQHVIRVIHQSQVELLQLLGFEQRLLTLSSHVHFLPGIAIQDHPGSCRIVKDNYPPKISRIAKLVSHDFPWRMSVRLGDVVLPSWIPPKSAPNAYLPVSVRINHPSVWGGLIIFPRISPSSALRCQHLLLFRFRPAHLEERQDKDVEMNSGGVTACFS